MRKTPPGTWPLLTSGAQLLLVTPAVLLGYVIPQWLAIGGAVVFTAVAVGAFVWSWAVYLRVRGTPASGVPIAGIALGFIAGVVSAGVLLPQSFA
jgi:hypothetical protein